MTDIAAFAARLTAFRRSAGLSQQELAERSGLSIRAISNLERARTRWPHPDTLSRLADALQLDDEARQKFVAAAGRRLARTVTVAPQDKLPSEGSGLVVPQQLPGPVRHFVGRENELAALTELLGQPGADGAAMVISAIGGTAGVGKTALALYWARQVAGRFPDGQLYVNLRGYAPGPPMPAADALTAFLRALGVPAHDIPADVEERAAQYRGLLATRRILVMLDNAREVEQVRPLLPGASPCSVIVTSRDSLAGLVARDGAQRLDLDLLSPADAVALLRALIGERADADRAGTKALADLCCRLPLALRVAAELSASRPAMPTTALAAELTDQHRKLDLLEAGGDPKTAVRAVFSWSYQHLDDNAARTFRLLGLDPGADLDVYAAAALANATVEQTGHALDRLARAYLTQNAGPGRYGLHDLLRAYAHEVAVGQDRADERRAALTRLFDHYLYTAAVAMDRLHPAERHRRPHVVPPTTPAVALTSPAAAKNWLDAHRACLVTVTTHAAGNGWPGHAVRLAAVLSRYLRSGGYYYEAVTIHGTARHTAHQLGDTAAEATALTDLGVIEWVLGRYQQSTRLYQQALALFRENGDGPGQARALTNLGVADLQRHRYHRATEQFRQALALFRENGDRPGQARALTNLGLADLRRRRYKQATEQFRQALALFRENGDRVSGAHLLVYLGQVELQQRRYQQATEHFQEALVTSREYGDRSGEADSLNGLGEVFTAIGQAKRAGVQHAAALDLAIQIGDTHEQARAHDGLAKTYRAGHDPDLARQHWEEALSLYTRLGDSEADQVRAQLKQVADISVADAASSLQVGGRDLSFHPPSVKNPHGRLLLCVVVK
jgi:tetratricopeptide (TPR) repeat protein/transcriptional regulator with XRE-family HTH domain